MDKPALSDYMIKAFGDNWHLKGKTFPRPKPGSKEVSKKDYDKVVAAWRKDWNSAC